MGKIIFNYGCMGSGKTSRLLTQFDTYKRRGLKPLIIKPCIDTRETGGNKFVGWGITKSRIIRNEEPVYYFDDLRKELRELEFGVLFVDESQFLTREDVLVLSEISDDMDIDIFCYGLRTDVTGSLFTGSTYLMALADELHEIETLCEVPGCTCKATSHIRYINGVRDNDLKSISIEGGEVSYKSVCRKHWKEL